MISRFSLIYGDKDIRIVDEKEKARCFGGVRYLENLLQYLILIIKHGKR
jgi:hypothetical protein